MSVPPRFQALVQRAFAFYDYLKEVGETCPVFPDHVLIEPTNACNLRCVHCHQSSRDTHFTKKIGVMKPALFEKIIADILPHATRITLNCQGEPLLHPSILEMVAHAKSRGLHVSILTNATKLSPATAERLLDLKLDRIAFSHEGSTKAIHEAVRRRSDHDTTLKNILYFILRNYERGRPTYVCMSMVVHSMTRDDLQAYQEYFGRLPIDDIFARDLVTLAGASPLAAEIDMSRHDQAKRPACALPWTALAVNWDGTVSGCSLDFNASHIVGDANTEDVVAIFNSPRMKRFRRCHLSNDLSWIESQGPLCFGCNQPFTDPECDIRRARENVPVLTARLAAAHAHTLAAPDGAQSGGSDPSRYQNARQEYARLTAAAGLAPP